MRPTPRKENGSLDATSRFMSRISTAPRAGYRDDGHHFEQVLFQGAAYAAHPICRAGRCGRAIRRSGLVTYAGIMWAF